MLTDFTYYHSQNYAGFNAHGIANTNIILWYQLIVFLLQLCNELPLSAIFFTKKQEMIDIGVTFTKSKLIHTSYASFKVKNNNKKYF